jgi:type IV pilus assembly protein PilA
MARYRPPLSKQQRDDATPWKRQSGVKLLELLLSLVITTLLVLLGIPIWANQSNRAKETEGRITITLINQAQYVYFVDKRKFADLAHLEVGLQNTDNYTYGAVAHGSALQAEAITYAIAKGSFKSYAGRVYLVLQNGTVVIESLVCEFEPGKTVNLSGMVTCPE